MPGFLSAWYRPNGYGEEVELVLQSRLNLLPVPERVSLGIDMMGRLYVREGDGLAAVAIWTVAFGVWHQVLWDSTNLYFDGDLLTTMPEMVVAGTPVEGPLSEVVVFSGDLSMERAQELYNAGEPRDLMHHPDLVGWWRLNGDGPIPVAAVGDIEVVLPAEPKVEVVPYRRTRYERILEGDLGVEGEDGKAK